MADNDTPTCSETGLRGYELTWMLSKRPLVHNLGQLKLDYPNLYEEMVKVRIIIRLRPSLYRREQPL